MSLTVFALTGSALVGLGVYGLLARPHMLRRVIAFNLFGVWAVFVLWRCGGAWGGFGPDPTGADYYWYCCGLVCQRVGRRVGGRAGAWHRHSLSAR